VCHGDDVVTRISSDGIVGDGTADRVVEDVDRRQTSNRQPSDAGSYRQDDPQRTGATSDRDVVDGDGSGLIAVAKLKKNGVSSAGSRQSRRNTRK